LAFNHKWIVPCRSATLRIEEFSMNPIYHNAQFLLSAVELGQLPAGVTHEVAFAGRSNAGKSSALNAITQQKTLARISKTPGRTQQINVFPIDEHRTLVDLPGYGYAKVSTSLREEWGRLLPQYFSTRAALKGVIVIMDIRHPLTPHDCAMLELTKANDLPVHVLLSKADKLKRGAGMNALQAARRELEKLHPAASIQLFSAITRQGVDEVHAQLDRWLFEAEAADADKA
jgi:GTP-binding protein